MQRFKNYIGSFSTMQGNIEDTIRKIDDVWGMVKAYPKNARPYKELFDLVVDCLNYLTNKEESGLIAQSYSWDLGDKYYVQFKNRLAWDSVFIYLKIPPGGDTLWGVYLLYIKIWHKPLVAHQYALDSQAGNLRRIH